ncbi:cytochrome P450 [Irpex rosettiformis]|uniref:Cytochrome P450 n=1 Tax=Irpex rosettiformis TaxID=378272 RepID=A0ACB8U8D1_9APHY|nr:cytochrome P450 [Irpex rosettiformis]
MHRLVAFGAAVTGLYVIQKVVEFRKAVKAVNDHPGLRTLLNTLGPIENFFPRLWGVTPGSYHMFTRKHRDFEIYGWDVITYVAAFWGSHTNFYVADADALNEITTYRARFTKPLEQYELLKYFGGNIVASEAEEWKRYRKISAPAFSERNNALVWDETKLIIQDLFNNVWGDQKEITVDHAVDVTLPLALFVIGVAGFGRRVMWSDDEKVPPGHTMNFKDALHIVAQGVFLKLVLPEWLIKLGPTKRLRDVRDSFIDIQSYLLEMIQERRHSEAKEERYDLFSALLDANELEVEEGEKKLLDSELIGNLFIFLIAGHETTAHTLCFLFALLALYPDVQEELHQHIKSICPDGELAGYEQMSSLTYCLAALNETLRLCPPVHSIPKSVAEDTTITITNAQGERTTLIMPKGSTISMHIPGLHYNPRYWKNPYDFNPKRFLVSDWPRDAFLPFSAGPRACLGRRFSETESVVAMAMIVLRYRITIKEEKRFAGETFEQRKTRVLQSQPGLTMTPLRVPLTFTRRY